MAESTTGARAPSSTSSAPASCSARRLRARPGRSTSTCFLGWDDTDWCLRIRDAGGEIVYLPSATVIHTYRRLTAAQPASRAAMRQLVAFLYFQRTYWSAAGRSWASKRTSTVARPAERVRSVSLVMPVGTALNCCVPPWRPRWPSATARSS